MTKQDVHNRLVEGDFPYGIAEVICDISCRGQLVYPNESILVVVESGDGVVNDDQIENSKHYTICDSIEDFDEGIVYTEQEARKHYCKYYVSEFKEVRAFESDFE